MKTLKLILFRPQNLTLFIAIFVLFIVDFILNVIVTPIAFSIHYIEKAIKYILDQIQ